AVFCHLSFPRFRAANAAPGTHDRLATAHRHGVGVRVLHGGEPGARRGSGMPGRSVAACLLPAAGERWTGLPIAAWRGLSRRFPAIPAARNGPAAGVGAVPAGTESAHT